MLGKVLKYEFKNSVAVMGIFYAALVLFTIMGCFGLHGLQIDSSASTPASVWFGVLLVFYFVGMVAVNVVSFIYFCKNYSTTMYSAQGYLTFTLPVNGNPSILSFNSDNYEYKPSKVTFLKEFSTLEKL